MKSIQKVSFSHCRRPSTCYQYRVMMAVVGATTASLMLRSQTMCHYIGNSWHLMSTWFYTLLGCCAVRLLREELQLLQEPGSYVGEVVKVMGKTKVLCKVHPEGKYVVDLDKVSCLLEVQAIHNVPAPSFEVLNRADGVVVSDGSSNSTVNKLAVTHPWCPVHRRSTLPR
jgi:hypothetical protein